MKFWSCSNMNEPWEHDAKGKKPATEDRLPYDSIDMKCLEKASLWSQKVY